MSKRIVICCDGTWKEPEQSAGEVSRPTNVVKLLRAVKPRAAGVEQVVFYDQGVGTAGWADKLLGGALGKGLARNVRDAYRFLANNFRPGDEIYCIGFSRGAFTVRSLCGLIDAVGILDKTQMEYLPRLYAYYRTKPVEGARRGVEHLLLDKDGEPLRRAREVPIAFLGVWDTVGSLGVPAARWNRLTERRVGFHDTELGPSVERAFQALAIDERRGFSSPAFGPSTNRTSWSSNAGSPGLMATWAAVMSTPGSPISRFAG